MGLFSGGFFGGGTNESKTSSVTTTNVSTVNKTRVRDIGLTGDDAVALAAVINASSQNIAASNFKAASDLYSQVGQTFRSLVGGVESLVSAGKEQTALVAKQQTESYDRLINISSDLMNPALALAEGSQKQLLYLGIAALVVLVAVFGKWK